MNSDNHTHLILGFTGGIGHAVALALNQRNITIRVLVRDADKTKKYIDGIENLEIIEGDAANLQDLKKAFDGIGVVHYCINIPYHHWEEQALQLFKKCVDLSVEHNAKLIFPGNVYVYGSAKYNPVDEKHPPAAHTKKGQIRMEMEEMLALAKRDHGLEYTIVRMPDFYGPFVINGFSEQLFINAIKGKSLRWIGNLNTEIELIYIEDGGEAMVMAALNEKSSGEVFNIPGISTTTAKQYLLEIAKEAESKSKISTLNSNFVFKIIGLFNPVVKELVEMLYLKREKLILNGTKYQKIIGTPLPVTDYKSGIRKTLDWVKEFYGL
jgi:nucleoside-diphosphate-sugar epimerase